MRKNQMIDKLSFGTNFPFDDDKLTTPYNFKILLYNFHIQLRKQCKLAYELSKNEKKSNDW